MKTFLQTSLFYCFVFFVCDFEFNVVNGFDWPFKNEAVARVESKWEGKWFPKSPDQGVDSNPIIPESTPSNVHSELHDSAHGIKMGVPSPHCDNAKINITIDWDESPVNHTCYEDRHRYLPREVHPILHHDPIPIAYSAPHECMDTPIFYEDRIPTFGPHRPLWARYGEYKFLPKQRWMHNLEHGAVVMLYHPCAQKHEVNLLKKIVKKCLHRHVITPYTQLNSERPLALVTWGHRLEMSKVVPKIVVEFIQNTALNGPEQKSDDGQFDYGLIIPAELVSDQDDTELCPLSPKY